VSRSLLDRSYAALLFGAQRASPSARYSNGYAANWEENLVAGSPLDEIRKDFTEGAGRELGEKFRAAHSSAALAVNTFSPWRTAPRDLALGGIAGFRSIRFEERCPTGLGGTPPHLDLLADGDLPVAVESKCTEWMQPKTAMFADAYDRLESSQGDSPWFEEMLGLRQEPRRYMFLDAAQLVKHYFGLSARYPRQEVLLIYLYWEPANHQDWSACFEHRAEANALAAKVEQSDVRLLPLSHRQLWSELERHSSPDHIRYLKARYEVSA
jgi:hypothetical protein